ncbi:MAG: type II secretion system protein GspE, partial [Deltaproteobacteria bacterium CG06_land_8_20_14_3_00_44_19]
MEVIEHIKDTDVDMALLREVPYFFARNNLVMPLRRREGFFVAAVAEDNGLLAASELARKYGLSLYPLEAGRGVVIDAISKFYGQIGTAEEVMDNIAGEDLSSVAMEFERPRDLLELTEDAPIIRLLNALFQQAVKEKASDIHIEPFEKELD